MFVIESQLRMRNPDSQPSKYYILMLKPAREMRGKKSPAQLLLFVGRESDAL
jgi:hypothetical protein